MTEKNINSHSITMTDCSTMTVTGVNDADSFDENQIRLFTECGELSVFGDNLHVNEMSVEKGSLTIEGSIAAIVYGDSTVKRKLSFLGRLLR